MIDGEAGALIRFELWDDANGSVRLHVQSDPPLPEVKDRGNATQAQALALLMLAAAQQIMERAGATIETFSDEEIEGENRRIRDDAN